MEATFSLPLMIAPDPGERPLLRLHWAFNRASLPVNTRIPFSWEAQALYLEDNQLIPDPLPAAPVSVFDGEFRGGSQSRVLVTEPQRLPAAMTEDSRLGAIRIRMAEIRPDNLLVFLLKVEVSYISNRIGRRV